MRKALLFLATIICCATSWAIDQDSEGYYLIGNANDWNTFAEEVNNNPAINARLTADIDIATMIGTSAKKFAGTFDGGGHTITATINSTSSHAAPFIYINNATITDLTVEGSIKGGIHCSGLVGSADGTNSISNVIVRASITTTGTHCGGIVGHGQSSNTTLTGCIFEGSISGGSTVGAIFGWNHGGMATITNCLEKGTTYSSISSFNGIFMGSNATVSNSYHLKANTNNKEWGAHVFRTLPDGEMGGLVTAVDGNSYYALISVSGINERYLLTGLTVEPDPIVSYLGTTLAKGTDYTLSYTDNDKAGTAYVNITGIGNFTGTKSVAFRVVGNFLQGNGTEASPFLINNDDDWVSFVSSINDGYTYSGYHIKLTDDINASVMAGIREDEPFSGIFNGDGHTINLNIVSNATGTGANAQGVAPFHFIKDAIIRNTRTTGTVSSSSYHTSGLVGFSFGTTLIEGCTVSATINTRTSYAGGVLGHSYASNTTMKDCIFDGTINGNNSSHIVGLYGWSHGGTPTVINCLEKGSYTGVYSFDPVINGSVNAVTDTYYLTPRIGFTDGYGTQVYVSLPEDEAGGQITAVDGNKYYVLLTASGLQDKYYLETPTVEPVPTVTFLGTTLTKDIDYTLSYADNDKGGTGYILIHALGNYTGTKRVPFTIISNNLAGDGSEESPFLIGSKQDWNNFSKSVSQGMTHNGRHIKLTANISVNKYIGTNSCRFSGIFDGDGHTLTVDISSDSVEAADFTVGMAPFHFIENATIKNLRIAGNIHSNYYHPSGLAGNLNGTNTIERCMVSATISTSTSYAGGIIGHANYSNTTVKDCLFNGTMSGNNSGSIAGIWGWGGGSIAKVENCLEVGTFENCRSIDAVGWNSTTVNTYHLNSSNKGTAATSETLTDGSIATALQAGRTEDVWVMVDNPRRPMLLIFANDILGDLDGNRKIEVNDVVLLAEIAMGGGATAEELAIGDMDGSGTIDVNDVVLLAGMVMGS